MFRFRRLLLASVLVSSALCVVPMSASADIYCVEVDPCVHLLEAGTTQTTIQLALDAAAANGVEDDVILVGSRVAPYVGPFISTDPEKVTLHLGDVLVAEKGGRARAYTEEQGKAVMAPAEITVRVGLGRGVESATVWTCDFSYDYVKINADYRS